MTTFHYPNLTIIEESQVQQTASAILGRAIIAKPHRSAQQLLCHQHIKDAIDGEFETDIEIEKISQFGTDYLVLADSPAVASHMLHRGSLNVHTFTVALLPWTTDYGSVTVPLHTQVSNNQQPKIHAQQATRKQELTIQISGIPPQLCCEATLHSLFNNICPITNISFNRYDLTYSVSANASPTIVPDIAHIAIKKTRPDGDILNIWTLWYEVMTSDMYPFAEPPSPHISTDHSRGHSKFDTTHEGQHQHQQYKSIDNTDEGASQPRDIHTPSSDHVPDYDYDVTPKRNSSDEDQGWESDRSYWKID